MQVSRLLIPALIPTAFFIGTLVNTGFTQQTAPNPAVLEVSCMKVDPLKEEDYLKLERDIWKPMHQERIRRGHMRSWTLYAVRYPTGTQRECDYRTVNVYGAVADIDRPLTDVAAKIHPKTPIADLFRRTITGRDLVRGELWYEVDQTR